MEITGKLDVQFFNFGQDQHDNPDNINAEEYQRVEGVWNVYYHGFMDRYCDIAYVKQRTVIQPGIYEVTTYGVDCYLFFWMGGERYRGLLVRKEDQFLIDDAYKKYQAQVSFM